MKLTRLGAMLTVSAMMAGCVHAPQSTRQGQNAAQAQAIPQTQSTPQPQSTPQARSIPPPPPPAQATAQAPPPAPALAAAGPIIQFDSATFDFGKLAFGTKVQHTFIVTNKGDQPLEISYVHPSCGCTTAGAWTHRIEEGQSGVIPIQFDSGHGNSGNITKTIEVTSNARNDPRVVLWLKGTVWKPIDVQPPRAYISIPPDSSDRVSTTVRLINETETPVTLSAPTSSNRSFTATLKESKPGKEFELLITMEPPFTTGNTAGTISMKSSLPGTPVVNVTAMANVEPVFRMFPPRIILNAVTDRWFTNRVTIHGNTTNLLLSLSNPAASDSRIHVDVRPLERAGTFNLTVAFPPGFELAPGQRAEVSVQSNHPRFPVIKVPILQVSSPRRVATLPAPPKPSVQTPSAPAGRP